MAKLGSKAGLGRRGQAGEHARAPARSVKTALLVTTALVFATPAFSQAAAPATQLETISVEGAGPAETARGPVDGFVATRSATATKTDTPLIETPQSIAVIGANQIQAQKAETLSEAVRYTPGVFAESFGANNRLDFYYIRGFKADDTGLYRDGLQLFSTGYANFRTEPFGLERIEVLRGPSSVLFGGTSPGGLINLVTKRPTADPLHYLEIGGGSFGRNYAAFDLSGPLTPEGDVLYRFTGLGRQGGTQVDYSKDDRLYLAPSLTFRPDGATTFTILTSYQQDHSNSVGFFLPYLGTVRPTQIGPYFGRIPTSTFVSDKSVDSFDRRQALLGYEFEHKFDDVWTFRQNFRFDYLDVQDHRLYGNGYADTAQSQLSRFNFVANSRVGLTTVDNQAEARFRTGPLDHKLLFGIDYKNYNLVQTNAFAFAPSFDFTAPVTRQLIPTASPYLANRQTIDQVGFYAQDQIRLDRFLLTMSGRQDLVNTSTFDRLFTGTATDQEDRAFSGRVGLLYESEIGVSPYASYSTSFSPLAGTNFYGRGFKPETGEQVEVGAKYQPDWFRGFFTVSAFDLRRNNVQVADASNILNQLQVGQIRSTGVEFQAVATLIDGLDLVGAYTVFDLRNSKVTDQATLGLVPTNLPTETASLFLDYTHQTGPFKGLGIGGGVRFVGSSYADPLNTYRVPDYTLFDGAVHYDRDGWRLAVNAQNLFDRTFVASCSTPNACFYGDRRKVTASLSYRW